MTIPVFILLIIFVLIQSIYGVGLLVFGVPTLLIVGLEYSVIIGLLLPSSVFLSSLQLIRTRNIKSNETKFLPLSIFGITVGLSISAIIVSNDNHLIIIGLAMLAVSVFRTHEPLKEYIGALLTKNRIIFHLLNSILHGSSNLGGAFLTIYSATVYTDKQRVLHCTALFYLVYALSQIIILIFIAKIDIFISGLLCVPLTAIIYLMVGEKTFNLISQRNFDKLATAFFFFTGIAFLARTPVF